MCASAWARGFCDGDGENGSTACRQARASYEWGTNGPILPDYSDLGPELFRGMPAPIHFVLVHDQLSSHLTQDGAKVVVLELTINRVNAQGPVRVLALSVGTSGGATVLYADWLETQPYWSSANEVAFAAETRGSAQYVPVTGAMTSNVSIVPTDDWTSMDLRIDGLSIATFAMPPRIVAGTYRPLRLRSGVISATEWHSGMAVEFEFTFPTIL